MADRYVPVDDTYTYHLGVYSKLIRGSDPNGPIKFGVEARVNGNSLGFPNHLIDLCRPTAFFRDQPMVTEVDPRKTPGGVFVYRPAYVNGRHMGMFARIEARSEEGTARASRRFTHCAVLFVEDKWEPALLPWAAEMLFTTRHGDRCWGNPVTERDEERDKWAMPVLTRSVLDEISRDDPDSALPLARLDDTTFQVRGRMPDVPPGKDTHVSLAGDIDAFLGREGLYIHGRWLSVALGIGPQVDGHGRGYFIRYDMRPEDAPAPRPVTLGFDDRRPPNVTGDFVSESRSAAGALVDWAALAPALPKGFNGHNTFKPENIWPDQKCPSVLADPAPVRQQPVSRRTGLDERTPAFHDNGLTQNIREAMAPPKPDTGAALLPFPMPRYLDNRQGVEPGIQTLDDIFDAAMLDSIGPAFRNLTGRIRLLDPAGGFGIFRDTADDPRIVAAFGAMAMAMIARCALADPDDMKAWVIQNITQPALPVIGFTTSVDRSGLVQVILSNIITGVGIDDIVAWCERQHRREMNLKIQKSRTGQVDPGYAVHAPNAQRIRTFFAWLDAVPFSATSGGTYDRISAESCNRAIERWTDEAAATLRARMAPRV